MRNPCCRSHHRPRWPPTCFAVDNVEGADGAAQMRPMPVLWRHGVLFAKAVDRVAIEKAMKGSAERHCDKLLSALNGVCRRRKKAHSSFLCRCLSAAIPVDGAWKDHLYADILFADGVIAAKETTDCLQLNRVLHLCIAMKLEQKGGG